MFTFVDTKFKLNACFILVFIWTLSLSVNYVKSDVVLFIDLLNFSNPNGALHTGECCDSYVYQEDCPRLPPRCDVGLRICIDMATNLNSSADMDSCFFGSYTLYGIQDKNTFEFRANPQAMMPFIFTISWNFPSVPRFLLKFYAMDDSSDKKMIVRNSRNKLIDYYYIDFNNDQKLIPSSGLSKNLNWIDFNSIVGQYSSSTFKTFFSFRAAMKCRTNYFTATCGVRCVQQDSCEGGHYSCDSKTGQKVCNYGFTDASTGCIKRDTAISLCSRSDSEFCSNNGFCYENYIRSSNVSVPTCCCNRGFGGPTCSDILSCEVNPCLNGGQCVFNSTERLAFCVCRLGFKGKFCETQIRCEPNMFGDDCSVQCQATDTCEIHQSCDYYGRLKCKDGWGSYPACNVRLINPALDVDCPQYANTSSSHPPCLNGGSCWKGTCCCPSSYTGPRCEILIDRCIPSPCLNSAQCVSTPAGFSCVCQPGFSGLFCQTSIDPCQNSTLQCSNSGKCVPNANFNGFTCSCNEGYTGRFCEKQIDYCASMPCMNNSTCVSVFRSFVCSCPIGYTGVICDRRIDLCSTQPCVHGSCTPLVNDYVCQCNQGWKNPKTCNEDINECLQTPSPCLNNGTCHNLAGSFGCYCQPGYTGVHCQTKIDYCASSPCVVAQSVACINEYNRNAFKCVCQPGFTGVLCDRAIDYCASQPCLRNQHESCVNYQSRYNCICKPGFKGVNCEIEENECESHPCLNGGMCVDHVNGYKCACGLGFTGDRCQSNIDPCQVNPVTNATICGSHGTCFPQYNMGNNGSNYFCQCIAGYQGRNCESTVSLCLMYSPCLNGATCLDVSANNFTCLCSTSYTGTYCEKLINPCLQGTQMCNTGTCINRPNGNMNFTCLCPNGYSGLYCQDLINPCEPNMCVPNQGFCQPFTMPDGSRTFKCSCIVGYTGELCESFIDQCKSSPCLNNGICQSLLGYFNCLCPPNYYGSRCEHFYECSRNPCDQSGTHQCVDLLPQQHSPSSSGPELEIIHPRDSAVEVKSHDKWSKRPKFQCKCRSGFKGARCESNMNECISSPCQNNSTCVDLVDGFVCKCPSNFIGTFCERQNDFCQQSNQCAAGSTCMSQIDGGFKCLCGPTQTGVLCNIPLDLCALLPCQNGGLCTNQLYDYTCQCLPGYSGKNCTDVVDQCSVNFCQNNSTCVSILNGFYCNCLMGFTGQYCQSQINYCQSSPNSAICLNGGTCVNTQKGFICICANGYTGARCDSFIDLCNTTVCRNNGLCRTSIYGTVYCTCPTGFTGPHCETSINYCDSYPCLNGASCLSFASNYLCYCTSNYIGSRCETKINFCQSSPCRNNATCIDQQSGFRCVCQPGYSGDICQIPPMEPCMSHPCVYGTCFSNPNGGYACSCNAGFTGSQCSDRIDICQSGINGQPACLNDGTCISTFNNSTNSYVCVCTPGYTGRRCEVTRSPCESYPCIRGSCSDMPGGTYVCQCPQGYTGVNCETDLNECQMSTVPLCFNNATCINVQGDFVCQCLNGFTGRFCELTIDNCFSHMCQHGALCINQVGLSYKCLCTSGYTGQYCETIIDFCYSFPCQNHATCLSSPSQPNFFSCACLPGFTGVLCDQLIDPCVSRPCLNNAMCINRSSLNQTNSFLCACPVGYTGMFCETPIDPCHNRCLNGGTCVQMGVTECKCMCPVGFTGVNCEVINSCLSYPCVNGGTCTISYPVGYQCICPNNFTGLNCDRLVSTCTPNPCLNMGTCLDRDGSYYCMCPTGFAGKNCQIASTCNPPCEFGKCISDAFNNNVCMCLPGYAGPTCSTDINECSSSPCLNGGLCTEPFLNMYICSCVMGFTGKNCEISIRVCDSQPCLNGGICNQMGPSIFLCTCQNGFTGRYCEFPINECESNPCKNGAICFDGYNKYQCQCVPGTEGVNCENDINECISAPCQNGAMCLQPQLNMYKCECMPGFTGVNCEMTGDPCASIPCKNNGLCVIEGVNSFRCVCPAQFTGVYCDLINDPCVNNDCTRNFADLNINFNGLPYNFNFMSYQDCILKAWSFLNPSIQFSKNLTKFSVESVRSALEFTSNIMANKATQVIYSLTVPNLPPSALVTVPTVSDYIQFCPSTISTNVTIYNQYWEMDVCGNITASTDIETIRGALLKLWQQKYPEINTICFCLNVDIFPELTHYFLSGIQQVTRLFYLVYANQFKRIIEKGTISDPSKLLTNDELRQALQQAGYQSCQSQIPPILFSLTICGPLIKTNLPNIISFLQLSWQVDASSGGLGSTSRVVVVFQGYQEYISDNSTYEVKQATKIFYNVYYNDQIIDQSFSIPYNYAQILQTFQDLNNCPASFCSPSYPYSYSFSIITPNKLCDSLIPMIETQLENWYRNTYNVKISSAVMVIINKDAIEQVVDDFSTVYYKIPVFIVVDTQVINSASSLMVYQQLQAKFSQIPITPSSNQTFQVIDSSQIRIYRIVQGFKFYLNFKLNLNNVKFVSDFIKQSFERTNKSYVNSQVSIRLQQDVIFYSNPNSFVVNRLVAFISDSNGTLYDSREENLAAINTHLQNLLANVNYIINDYNQNLVLFEALYILQFQVLQYSDLFQFYVKNKYLSISPSDLIKISTWLNDEWSKYLLKAIGNSNIKPLSIFLINNQLYFDNGNLVIGINYMVNDVHPQCISSPDIQESLRASFISNLIPLLCSCGYEYYAPSQPTTYFYSIDFIGSIARTEKYHVELIRTALIRAWTNQYPSLTKLNVAAISNRFEARIGSLGTPVTRIAYIITINNQQILSYLYQAPTNSSIETQIRLLGSDLRIYPDAFSIGKAMASTLYVQAYPLSPFNRSTLETSLKRFHLQRLDLPGTPEINATANVLFYELYLGQQSNQNVSRVYYTFSIFERLYYPCELQDLYMTSLTTMPSSRAFDYMIKTRYLDVMVPRGSICSSELADIIRKTWYSVNIFCGISLANINVNLISFSFYTSIFRPIITRYYYFITINNFNVNDLSIDYIEPNTTDFNQTLINDVQASYYFPSKAYRVYLVGDTPTINVPNVQNALIQAWISFNTKSQYSSCIPVTTDVNSIVDSKLVRFYDFNKNYTFLSRLIYKVLFKNYADQNDLFNLQPNLDYILSMLVSNYNIPVCDRITCIPALFYDFYSLNNYTIEEARQSLSLIRQAWIIQNFKQMDYSFQSRIHSNIYSVIPRVSTCDPNMIVYRVIYAFAVNYRTSKNKDSSDFIDPTDEVYNQTLRSIMGRINYTDLIIPQPLIADTVVGIQWWMILIIILAALLLIALLLLCIYALFVRSRNVRYINMGSYPSSSTSSSSNVYPTSITATTFGVYPPTKSQDISFDPSLSTTNYYNQVQPTHVHHETFHHHHTYNPRYNYGNYGEPIGTVIYSQVNPTATISSLDSAYYQSNNGLSNRNRSHSASYLGSPSHVQVISAPGHYNYNYGRSMNNLGQNDSYLNDFNVIEQYEARIS